jgi:poly [ADP-ribose] polymerase
MWIENLNEEAAGAAMAEFSPEFGAKSDPSAAKIAAEAAMVVFYPEFDVQSDPCAEIVIVLDMSNSMSKNSAIAKEIATDFLEILGRRNEKKFVNVVKFGNFCSQLFLFPRILDSNSLEECKNFIKDASPDMGNTNFLPVLTNSIVKRHPFLTNLLLISDGHLTDLKLIVNFCEIRANLDHFRIFGFGIGNFCDVRSLQIVAESSGGAVELFDPSAKFAWDSKLRRQIYRLHQPSIENVRVVWNSGDSADPADSADSAECAEIVQAPKKISSVFNGERVIVYGFVPHC